MKSQERIGELFIITEAILYSLFPIITSYTSKIMPPILFAGLTICTSSIAFFIYLLITKKIKKIFNKELLWLVAGISVFNIILSNALIFFGSSKTSGINTTLLLKTEIVFTLVIWGLFFGEKITRQKLIGCGVIFLGAIATTYHGGQFQINTGDIFIMLGTMMFPFGNYLSKKALKISEPVVILFGRSLIGGIVLMLMSLLLENYAVPIQTYVQDNWIFILLNGLLVAGISKILCYEAFKRLDISKAVPMGLGISAGFSFVLAMIFLKENPTLHQIAGFIGIIGGVFILMKRKITSSPPP